MTHTRTRLPQIRVTVNARCGRACFFCRPSGEAVATSARASIDPDALIRVASVFRGHGISAMKLTGGDPALWPPLVDSVRRLKHDVGFDHIQVLSRHPDFGALAPALVDAGVSLLNMSIDTLRPTVHHDITGIDDHADVLDAILRCVQTGAPVIVNTVVMNGVNLDEIKELVNYCAGVGVNAIKLLDVIADLDQGDDTFAARLNRLQARDYRDLYTPLDILISWLRDEAVSESRMVQGGLGHPMLAFTMPSGLLVIVKDHRLGAWYGSICDGCAHYPCHDALMALRLTADLRLQFCLLRDDITVNLQPLLAERSDDALEATISDALDVYDHATFHESRSGHPQEHVS